LAQAALEPFKREKLLALQMQVKHNKNFKPLPSKLPKIANLCLSKIETLRKQLHITKK
jgi:hypothetical protein